MFNEKKSLPHISLWLPEWEKDAVIADLDGPPFKQVKSLRLFGVYFDEEDDFLMTDPLIELYEEIKQKRNDDQELILSIVNDYVKDEGPTIQKDSTLLHRLIKDDPSRQQHIEEIVQLTARFEIDGIEIDYERIDEKDIDHYIQFIQDLYERLKERNKSLYVVLEPNFNFQIDLPRGPQYSVMAYNVHGYHSGPGAKATFSFLEELMSKLQEAKQPIDIALATGGFIWSEKGEITAVTEKDVERILDEHKITVSRDKKSSALSFEFEYEKENHEVWYADVQTLQDWIHHIKRHDATYHHFPLWRFGGLSEDVLNWIEGSP